MKLFVTLAVFAEDKGLHSHLLIDSGLQIFALPKVELHQFNSEVTARKLFKEIFNVDWGGIFFRKEGLFEESIHTGHIFYSVFLEEKLKTQSDYKWFTLENLKDLPLFEMEMIKEAFIKRY